MNNQQINPEKMTRQQYREWQKRQASKNNRPVSGNEGLVNDTDNLNDGFENVGPSTEAEPMMPRQAVKQAQAQELAERKTAQLKRRLNWAILGLSLAIIVVYLILFFVG